MPAQKVRPLSPLPFFSFVRGLLLEKINVSEWLKHLALQGYVPQASRARFQEASTGGANATSGVIPWRKNAGWRKSVSQR